MPRRLSSYLAIGAVSCSAAPVALATTPVPSPVISPSQLVVDVSPEGLESIVAVSITSIEPGNITVGAIPTPLLDNLTIGGSGNALTMNGSGFGYADIGFYTIPFTSNSQTNSFSLSIVPEPASLAAAGFAGLAAVRRRRR